MEVSGLSVLLCQTVRLGLNASVLQSSGTDSGRAVNVGRYRPRSPHNLRIRFNTKHILIICTHAALDKRPDGLLIRPVTEQNRGACTPSSSVEYQ